MIDRRPLTKREVLQITYELWTWLAEHPAKAKSDWPGWTRWFHMTSDCPCCSYALQLYSGGTFCSGCPLLGLWPHKCTSDESPFITWYTSGVLELRRDAALQIATFSKQELDKLTKDKSV